MRILITGKGGKSGSWQIRGLQLGEAIGAEIQPLAEPSDCRSADVVIVVKRTPASVLQAITASGKPWVLDIVDGWPQPCTWGEIDACAWLKGTLGHLQPTAVVFGTRRMQQDSGFAGPSLVLPHHAWPKYKPVSIRQSVQAVGYEGDIRYLGRWQRILETECDRRGWKFEVNGDMQRVDIGVALRDNGGYPARWWKPGTKLANLQALGLPALVSPESGYNEIASGAEFWIKHPEDVLQALNTLADPDVRSAISVVQQQSAPRLESIAASYVSWLNGWI